VGDTVPGVMSVRAGITRAAEPVRTRPGGLVDVVIVLVAAASVVRIWLEPLTPQAPVTAAALLATLPLLVRRQSPLGAPLAALLGCLGLTLLIPGALWEQLQFFFCALLCAWVFGSENRPRRGVLGLGVALVVGVISVITDPRHHALGDYVFAVAITSAAWTAGRLFGERARQAATAEREARRLAEDRERQAIEAVATERARLARELHDVIAHTVSVMVVQAGAAQQVLGPGNDQAREAMEAVRSSGKTALAELRRMLGLLRDDETAVPEGVQPGLAALPELAGAVSSAGTDVRLGESGTARSLEPGLDQTCYRIVQEALTNTMKHAGPARAAVDVRWETDAVVLEISDDGAGVGATAGNGRGIVGMRERVRLYGGELSAGPLPGGGFRVTARLPA
jgi:signal transduction histidine kinase